MAAVSVVADVVLAPEVASAVSRLEPRELRSCQLTNVCYAFSETTEPAHLRLDLNNKYNAHGEHMTIDRQCTQYGCVSRCTRVMNVTSGYNNRK